MTRTLAALLLALAGLLWGLGYAWQQQAVAQHPLLPVAFEHSDHAEQGCLTCHHNFVDDTGSGQCYICHKQHPEVGVLTQMWFHDFCRDCHVEKRLLGEDAGPVRSCRGCHGPERR